MYTRSRFWSCPCQNSRGLSRLQKLQIKFWRKLLESCSECHFHATHVLFAPLIYSVVSILVHKNSLQNLFAKKQTFCCYQVAWALRSIFKEFNSVLWQAKRSKQISRSRFLQHNCIFYLACWFGVWTLALSTF